MAFGVVLDFGTKDVIDCSIGMECIAAVNRYSEEGHAVGQVQERLRRRLVEMNLKE